MNSKLAETGRLDIPDKLAKEFLTLTPVWSASRTTSILSKSRKLRLTAFLPLTGQPAEKWSWRVCLLSTVLTAQRCFIT